MKVTITEFERMALDQNGNPVPSGHGHGTCQTRTTTGDFTALAASTTFIRVATDTVCTLNIAGGDAELYPVGVFYRHVNGGETLTLG